MRVAVINLSGAVGLKVARSPFDEVDSILDRIEADAVVVDFHAEVTSEKVAMGWHLDGRVAAVLGTHTHVPTADGRVLPQGTAFISDVGMTGSRTSVLGVKPEQALASMITQMPIRFETASEDVWVMGAVVEVNSTGTGRLDRAGDGACCRVVLAHCVAGEQDRYRSSLNLLGWEVSGCPRAGRPRSTSRSERYRSCSPGTPLPPGGGGRTRRCRGRTSGAW